jgi:predicted TPR repeat methyltransferase
VALTGLDVSEALLKHARKAGRYDELRKADLNAPLSYADDLFDATMCVGTLTYVAGGVIEDKHSTNNESTSRVRPSV